jgi:hypothetical protein
LSSEIAKAVSASMAELFKAAQQQKPPVDSAAEPGSDSAKPGASGGGKEDDNPVVRELRRELAKLKGEVQNEKTAREEATRQAEVKERHAQVLSHLTDLPFRKDGDREAAHKLLRDEVKRGTDGKLYGPDGETPASDYIKKQMSEVYDSLLKPLDAGGAGARNPGGPRSGAPVDFDMIRPGMSKEDEIRVRQQISRVLTGRD